MECAYPISQEDDFNNLIEGKSILYIPIVSSIDRKTNLYNLAADGNINRTITTFLRNDSFKRLTLVLPEHHQQHSGWMLEKFNKEVNEMSGAIVEFHYSPYFGIHAGEQRSNPYIIQHMIDELCQRYECLDSFDYVIADSQYLIQYLIEGEYVEKSKIIFWNYLCSTDDKGRSFTDGLKDITLKIMTSNIKMIVTSPDLVKYACSKVVEHHWHDIFYIPTFMDRDYDTFNYEPDKEIKEFILQCKSNYSPIIYLPYRLTDEAYQIEKVIDFIECYTNYHWNAMCKTDDIPVMVVYSDPNNSGMMNDLLINSEKLAKLVNDKKIELNNVSPKREVFYTFIDSKYRVTIPYFEDIEFANHAAIWEFAQSNANVYLLDKFAFKNYPYYEVTQINQFLPASRFMKSA